MVAPQPTFNRFRVQLVAGVVAPPKLELANQDLIKSHVYSIWLAHTGVYLEDSMNKILDLELGVAEKVIKKQF